MISETELQKTISLLTARLEKYENQHQHGIQVPAVTLNSQPSHLSSSGLSGLSNSSSQLNSQVEAQWPRLKPYQNREGSGIILSSNNDSHNNSARSSNRNQNQNTNGTSNTAYNGRYDPTKDRNNVAYHNSRSKLRLDQPAGHKLTEKRHCSQPIGGAQKKIIESDTCHQFLQYFILYQL